MENVTGSWIIAGSMKSSGDSNTSKNFRLKVSFKDVPVQDVIMKALEPTKIAWVNGQGRKKFDSIENNQMIEIDFKSPARAPQVDSFEAEAQKLSSMTAEEQQAYFAEMVAKAATMNK